MCMRISSYSASAHWDGVKEQCNNCENISILTLHSSIRKLWADFFYPTVARKNSTLQSILQHRQQVGREILRKNHCAFWKNFDSCWRDEKVIQFKILSGSCLHFCLFVFCLFHSLHSELVANCQLQYLSCCHTRRSPLTVVCFRLEGAEIQLRVPEKFNLTSILTTSSENWNWISDFLENISIFPVFFLL